MQSYECESYISFRNPHTEASFLYHVTLDYEFMIFVDICYECNDTGTKVTDSIGLDNFRDVLHTGLRDRKRTRLALC